MQYVFSDRVNTQLEPFCTWLRAKRYAPTTVRQYRNYAGHFLQWLTDQQKPTDAAKHSEVQRFLFQLKEEQSTRYLARMVHAIRMYYRFTGLEPNPAAGWRILHRARRLVQDDTVPYPELLQLYRTYATWDDRTLRNKVILGILVFQAVTSRELARLEPGHVLLRTGQIQIPGSARSNRRVLLLDVHQLFELQHYLDVVRPRMLSNIQNARPGRSVTHIDPDTTHQLFFSERGATKLKNSLYHLFRHLKTLHPKVTTASRIRQSVLRHWLKTEDVRIVQYKAGHRYVSSTERYREIDLEELKEGLKKHHPLR